MYSGRFTWYPSQTCQACARGHQSARNEAAEPRVAQMRGDDDGRQPEVGGRAGEDEDAAGDDLCGGGREDNREEDAGVWP